MIAIIKKTIADLRKNEAIASISIIEKRKHVRIAVIDDEEFKPLDNLLSDGYQIAYLGKHTDLRALRQYHIIICDIEDVGAERNSVEHGAAIIEEIKRVMPEKPVIAYTGLVGNIKKLNLAKERADEYIPKASQPSIWNETLDACIDQCLDPTILWEHVKGKLSEADVSTKEIASLEDKFVRAVINGDAAPLSRLKKKSQKNYLKGPISRLLASAIWGLLTA